MKRIIIHADVNSAFLSWSAVRLLREGACQDLRLIPSAVGGDEKLRKGIILAKSIPAKKYGVTTGEPIWQAKKKCPDLVIIPGDYALYSRMSNSFMSVVKDFSPLCQQFSVDECFIDYSGMEKVLGPPEQAADELRKRVKERLGFTVSVGVSTCKVLAKMAGELKKPDAVSTLYPSELEEKLWPLPVRELFLVGRATEKKLVSLGISNIGALAHSDPQMIKKYLGLYGTTIWEYSNGIDPDPVIPSDKTPVKSYSQSATLPVDLLSPDEIIPVLSKLCSSLAYRMRSGGACCSVVSLYLKDSSFNAVAHQHRLSRPSDITCELLKELTALFYKTYQGGSVRAIGISFSDLCSAEGFSLSLFDDRSLAKKIIIDGTCDKIKNRYGGKALSPASELLSPQFAHLTRYEPTSDRPRTFCPF
ncbi:MAG: DNA polymerase IV [Clostridiaceae bacterium]|nr:DNA polymerase IV [Clostridiaceae bacterium]